MSLSELLDDAGTTPGVQPKPARISYVRVEEDYVVISKPPGLSSVPDRFDSAAPCVVSVVSKSCGPIWPVHRLQGPSIW